MTSPILILGPMASEIDALTAALSEPQPVTLGGYGGTAGLLDGVPVVTVRCLIGMVHAAAATALAAARFQPRCVIIQGTCGAHDPTLHRGDLVIGSSMIETGSYYAPHRDAGAGSDWFAYTFPGVQIPADGGSERARRLPSDPALVKLAEALPYEHGVKRTGTIGSGDVWNRELDVIDRLHREHGSLCEEMEGFAVAQVCRMLGVPMLNVRVVGNSEWYPDEDELDESVGVWCQEFCRRLAAAIDRSFGNEKKQ